MGRTGRLFAHEWAGITPDIMMVAKGIGGGFPLGAVLATEARGVGHGRRARMARPMAATRWAARWAPRSSRSIADPAFLAEVARKGALFRQRLEGLVAAHPTVFDGGARRRG